MTETSRQQTPEEMTRSRIALYRHAAAGGYDVHQWGTKEGEIYHEVFAQSGDEIPDANFTYLEPILEHEIVYLGSLTPKGAKEIADQLEEILLNG